MRVATTIATTTATDGHRIGYSLREPAGDPSATIVFLPALGVPLTYYTPLLDAWADAGRRVVGVEHRGQPTRPTRGRFGFSDMIRRDLPAIFALPEVRDAARVALIGHSMGGALALLSTAAGVVEPHAVVTIATGTSWCAAEFGAWRRIQRAAGIRVVRAVTRMLGYWPGHRLGFGGRQPSIVMRDWAYEATHGRFRLHGDPFDYEAALSRMTTPRLLLGIEGDPLINPRAVALMARRAAGADRHQVRAANVDHFSWARRAVAEVATPIDRWLAF